MDPPEKDLAQSPAGADQVREFHRRLFAHDTDILFQEIKSITGMEVRDTAAELELTTGSVVQVFTTATVGEDSPPAPAGPVGTRALGHGPPRRHKGRARREANKSGCVIRG